MIDQKRLMELFNYDPDSGFLTWKVSRGNVKKGNVAGCPNSEGYLCVGIDKNVYHVHRIAWIYVYGQLPTKQVIDHINRIKTDNRISNLRAASVSDNLVNKGIQKNNKSGCRGISWNERDKKWRVVIKKKDFGYYQTFDEAKDVWLCNSKYLLGDFLPNYN